MSCLLTVLEQVLHEGTGRQIRRWVEEMRALSLPASPEAPSWICFAGNLRLAGPFGNSRFNACVSSE